MGCDKEKTQYIDDGRTIADMSNVSGGLFRRRERSPYKPRSSFKEKWSTYWGAVKMMLLPMLVAVAAILIVYLLMTLWALAK